MSNKILAVDPGHANTGIAVMAIDDAGSWHPVHLQCIRTLPSAKKHGLLKSSDDVRRVQETAAALMVVIREHEIHRMVVELPNGGALSSDACRAMALASATIATLAEALEIAVEYYSPRETRAAAGVPKAVRKGKEIKELVMSVMAIRYPEVGSIKTKAEKEHICDALATFDAARRGNFIRGA